MPTIRAPPPCLPIPTRAQEQVEQCAIRFQDRPKFPIHCARQCTLSLQRSPVMASSEISNLHFYQQEHQRIVGTQAQHPAILLHDPARCCVCPCQPQVLFKSLYLAYIKPSFAQLASALLAPQWKSPASGTSRGREHLHGHPKMWATIQF